MPKARTVAARRRMKKLAASRRPDITLAGGDSVPTPLRGRDRRGTQEAPDDAMRTVTEARTRQAPQHSDHARAPMAGEPIGLCILELAKKDERAALWATWCALSAARRTYRARIIGQTGEPKNAAIAMLPDDMQTDQSPRVDLRDPDAKDADAVAAWQRWQARLSRIEPPQLRWALRDPLDNLAGALWAKGAPTHRGRNAVQALRRLAAQEKEQPR